MITQLFQNQILKNRRLSKESLDSQPNKYYESGRLKEVGDLELFTLLERGDGTNITLTFIMVHPEDFYMFTCDQNEFNRMNQCKDNYIPIIKRL